MSAGETETSGKVRLFVYAPDEADLQQIVEVAKSMETGGLYSFTVEVLTWPEARGITPSDLDFVVGIFTKSAATTGWIGSAGAKWWERPELWSVNDWRALNRLFYLKPTGHEQLSDGLAFRQAAETETLREMQTAWYGRAEAEVTSVVPFTAELIVNGSLPGALAIGLSAARDAVMWAMIPPEFRMYLGVGGGAEPGLPTRAMVEGSSLVEARFAVYGPHQVQPQRQFILDLWAFHPDLKAEMEREAFRQGRHQVLGSKGPIGIELGTVMSVAVTVPSFRIEPPVDAVLWDGKLANTTYTLCSEPEASPGPQIGTATVMSGGVPIAVVKFQFYLQEVHDDYCARLLDRQKRISTVFASYAHEDRVEVLQWARGAEVVGVDVFLDVLKNREGTEWEAELFNHVPTKDLFCLFWSEPASQSRWVDLEWRCALTTRGLDYIHPVPLVDPRIVPPPAELRSKHFSSPVFMMREYEKGMGSDKEL